MSLFAISDLHLSLGTDKPMDVFGPSWTDYTEKILKNWQMSVTDDDTVIIGGDVSWATYLDDAKADFEFLNSLPGKKVIIKGNHDYWWESITKLNKFATDNNYDKLSFLNNSAYICGNFSIAGTRGWIIPSSDGFGKEDLKIYNRELIRLSLSLEEAARLERESGNSSFVRIAVLHYPPVTQNSKADDEILSILLKHGVKKCIYGHLHGNSAHSAFTGEISGIEFSLTSADYLGFTPLKIHTN